MNSVANLAVHNFQQQKHIQTEMDLNYDDHSAYVFMWV